MTSRGEPREVGGEPIINAVPTGGTAIKLGEVVTISDLHRHGLSVSAIALQLGIGRKTVRKYLARDLEPPVYITDVQRQSAWPVVLPHWGMFPW